MKIKSIPYDDYKEIIQNKLKQKELVRKNEIAELLNQTTYEKYVGPYGPINQKEEKMDINFYQPEAKLKLIMNYTFYIHSTFFVLFS